ncbi:MAG: Gfo/Idh/MocA family oxidoreductase [Candidatus Hydrogenedentes bacterium]|nr:Gfo/Idh/MocA family oxidoreductase [Candidatus Hydrogenedentota bacterium]
MGKIKIGFAGVGYMGQVAHLRNYLRNPDCEVVAIAEPRAELARRVAEKYGIPRIYQNHLELAEDKDVQAVVASQPFLLNGFITIPLLQAGKNCFIEKPMAGSLEEAEEMVRAARDSNVLIMLGFMKRYDSGVARAKEFLDRVYVSGEFGEPGLVNAYCFGGDWTRQIEGPISTDEPFPKNPGFTPKQPTWMTDAQKDTFNLYMNIFSHNVNLVRYLFPKKLEVRTAVLRERSMTQSTVLEGDGVIVNLYGMGVSTGWWEERTEIYFSNGWVRVLTPSPLAVQDSATVEIYHAGKVQETRVLRGKPYWAFRAQADHFIECLKENKSPRTNGEECLEDMRLMEDAFRKAQWV